MITTQNLTVRFGNRILFEDVSVKFRPGHCYGLIGANGTGKSTFLKCLAGDIEANSGEVLVPKGERLSVLRQDHFAFDDVPVLKCVLRGHTILYEIMEAKDEIYAKEDFSDEDGIRVSELEAEFADLNGWDAEPAAAELLSNLGIPEALHEKLMKDLDDDEKVRVLLAQALFGDPDIVLLDEPTNHLDVQSILWLEEFLANFKNTVIVVSHDRHFLNNVCTHVADIDFQKIRLYVGNYDFWYHSSQLALSQKRDTNKKQKEKAQELKDFIARFSANASKSRQATSRKKMLEKLVLDDIAPSSRKYPHIVFTPERPCGRDVLRVENLSKTVDGEKLFENITFTVSREDKIAFAGADSNAVTALLDILAGTSQPDTGEVFLGKTITRSSFPKENNAFFDGVDTDLVNWLRQYSENQEENFIRSFLGRMLFTGEESEKKAEVLSGGERVRCMLARMMMQSPNLMVLDGPTNHLDLESITALNEGMTKFPGALLFASHDVELVNSVSNRIIEVSPNGMDDLLLSYDEYLEKKRLLTKAA